MILSQLVLLKEDLISERIFFSGITFVTSFGSIQKRSYSELI